MHKLVVSSQAYYEVMVRPHFADLVDNGNYLGTLGEWSVMDDITSKRTVIDILGGGNILKRRDASCDIVWSPVARGELRQIEVDKIYGATKSCDEEFYTGCLEDFEQESQKFRDYILSWFYKLIAKDMASNCYFGNITRPGDQTGVWSWNVFDGVFKWISRYIANGTIPASQTTAIPGGTPTANDALNYLKWAYSKQSPLMRSLPNNIKAFYVSQEIADAYEDYLIATGTGPASQFQNGFPQLFYKGIPVLVEPIWGPVMTLLNGGVSANAVILTIRGNFVFGTDKNYGVGPKRNEAFRVWYSDDDMEWKYYAAAKAGTQIALPEHLVIASTSIN
jgi:hypothetical protein